MVFIPDSGLCSQQGASISSKNNKNHVSDQNSAKPFHCIFNTH